MSLALLKTPPSLLKIPASNKSKVLFVDDEERILSSLKALFRMKYDVITTSDGYEALRLLKEHKFDLIISDQRMPIMKGVDLLIQAKTISPNTVRVLLTGFSDLADLMGSVNDGEIFRFVSKPWDNDEITEIVSDGVNIGIELSAAEYSSQSEHSSDEADIIDFAKKHVQSKGLANAELKPAANNLRYTNPSEPLIKNQGVIAINVDTRMFDLISASLPHCIIYSAKSHDHAIEILGAHEVAVIVSMMDGGHQADSEFFASLKKEQPQITSIIIGPSGDADALTELINYARVFRYMFQPMKPELLGVYLQSAFKEYEKHQRSPTLLKLQSTFQPKNELESPIAKSRFGSAIKGLKRFFGS